MGGEGEKLGAGGGGGTHFLNGGERQEGRGTGWEGMRHNIPHPPLIFCFFMVSRFSINLCQLNEITYNWWYFCPFDCWSFLFYTPLMSKPRLISV